MAPGHGTRTLTVNGRVQQVRVVGTSTVGCSTGDVVLVLEDQHGRRSMWMRPCDQASTPSLATGETRGTLR